MDAGLSGWNPDPPPLNAVRGFPPAPGEPLPVYPPGPFAAWNRGSQDRSADRGPGRYGRVRPPGDPAPQAAATITPDEFDTNHSIPAIRDPAPAGKASRARTAAPAREHQPARTSPGGQRKGRGPGRRPSHFSAWLAIVAAAAIIAVGAGILVLTSQGGNPSAGPEPTSTPSNSVSSPVVPTGPWRYIGSRGTDPVPLSMHELYPASFTSAGDTYAMIKEGKGKNCLAAIIGSTLQNAIQQGNCTQQVRATYVAKTPGVMATIGVFNLRTSHLAYQAAGKAGHSDFVAQLKSKTGPASHIGQGTGIEEAVVKGHYLVLVWAERTNLAAPKGKAGRASLESFMNMLVQRTVNVGLSYRMVDGKPKAS